MLYLILLEYVKPLEAVDSCLAGHRAFLDDQYAAGRFIVSGRMNPRTGGVILSRGSSRAEIETVIAQDPFKQAGVASYTVHEFEPGMYDPGFAPFV